MSSTDIYLTDVVLPKSGGKVYSTSSRVTINASPSISQKTVTEVCTTFKPFKDWINKVTKFDPAELKLLNVELQQVDYFGSNKIGFVKLKATVENKDKKLVPGIVFLRGASVAVLVVFMCNGHLIAIGASECLEIPAGMMDDNGSFIGQAATELKEETDIIIKESDLILLTKIGPMYPSPGACDEEIQLYLYYKEVDETFLSNLQGRIGGNRDSGERIKVKVVEYSKLIEITRDAKALAAILLAESVLREEN